MPKKSNAKKPTSSSPTQPSLHQYFKVVRTGTPPQHTVIKEEPNNTQEQGDNTINLLQPPTEHTATHVPTATPNHPSHNEALLEYYKEQERMWTTKIVSINNVLRCAYRHRADVTHELSLLQKKLEAQQSGNSTM